MSDSIKETFFDVRMRGFHNRTAVDDVLAILRARTLTLPAETVPLLRAAGRVLSEAVGSPVDVPNFPRAAMDGFAVRAEDTATAIPLAIVGMSLPARPFIGEMKPEEAVRIATGAPIPTGADAVLMVEFAAIEADGRVRATASVPCGKHIIRVGEDVARGREVLPTGRRLRPQDVGLLTSIGADSVRAVRRPRVAILVTGDELLPPGAMPEGFAIVDSNSPMLTALLDRDGAELLTVQYLRDEHTTLLDAIHAIASVADVILISGGTSVGPEDHAPRAVAELGELAVHGVAIRPAGPMGVGFVAHTVVFLLPGNPVACLCAYDLFAGRVVRRLGGRAWELPYRKVSLPLAGSIVSSVGRVDYVRVKLDQGQVVSVAASGASNLSSTVAADGFILVPHDCNGFANGKVVDVWLYE